jgi:hypothetical protein
VRAQANEFKHDAGLEWFPPCCSRHGSGPRLDDADRAAYSAETPVPLSRRESVMRATRPVGVAWLVSCAALLVVGAAAAGTLSNAKVIAITVRTSGSDALITLSSELAGGPVCPGPLVANQVAFDHTTPGGKSILSLATSAYLSGKTVSVSGNDTCVPGPSEGTFVEGLVTLTLQ